MADSYGKVVAVIKISEHTEIHVKAGAEFKGVQYVDIRKFVKSEKYTGYTKDGIMIPKEHLKDVVNALAKILG